MKKVLLLFLSLLFLIPCVDAGIITKSYPSNYYPNTISPVQFGSNTFGFNTGYNNFNNGYNNSSCNHPHRRYNNRYNHYNNNNHYRGYRGNYYGNQNPYNNYYRRPILINRVNRSSINSSFKNVSNKHNKETSMANFSYPKVTQAEKTILGRTYEAQDLDLRLNRLEKSVFNKTFPTLSFDDRVNNIIVNFNKDSVSEINLTSLSRLENKVLGRNYAFDTPKARIERIESKMFGACQSGKLAERFETIKHASSNYKPNVAYGYESPYSPCYQNQGRPSAYTPPIVSGGGFKSMLGSLGNFMFGGYPTGYTPQMDPAYMDYFEAERAMQNGGSGEDVDIRTNRGYYKSNTQRQSGMGVTLLD